eukprot:7672655-Karenia_brevis.AAC.1
MTKNICIWGLGAPQKAGETVGWQEVQDLYGQVCELVVASAKEPLYDSSMEDPKHPQWGKVVEPIVIPTGEDGQP